MSFGYSSFGFSQFGFGDPSMGVPAGEFHLVAADYLEETALRVFMSARAQERGPSFADDALAADSWVLERVETGEIFNVRSISFDAAVDGLYILRTSKPLVSHRRETLRVFTPALLRFDGLRVHPEHNSLEMRLMTARGDPDRERFVVQDQDYYNRMDGKGAYHRDGAMIQEGGNYRVESGRRMYTKWIVRILARGIVIRPKELAIAETESQRARSLEQLLLTREWIEDATVNVTIAPNNLVTYAVSVKLARSTRAIVFESTEQGLLMVA